MGTERAKVTTRHEAGGQVSVLVEDEAGDYMVDSGPHGTLEAALVAVVQICFEDWVRWNRERREDDDG